MKNLTKNFTHCLMFVSSSHPDLARSAYYTRAPKKYIDTNLFLLCHLVLQPVRDFLACPVYVTSGYRDKALNDAIPGSSGTSLHLRGMAADITTSNKQLLHFAFGFIKENLADRFGELILYIDEYNKPINIHVALPKWGKEPYIEKRVKKGTERFTGKKKKES